MQTRITTALIVIPLLTSVLAGLSTFQPAHAWNLLVGVRGAQSGHDNNIVVTLNGQNGYKDSTSVPIIFLNSGGNTAVFNVPEYQIPSGSRYEVCAYSDNTLLKSCETFTHDSRDENVGLVLMNTAEKKGK
jgi:hypothetical protein